MVPYWRAVVERPDGAGGWIQVGVYGTPDTPGKGIGRYLHAATPMDAARLLLSHVWPVDLGEFNQRKDPGKWMYEQALTGIAEHRITIDVCEENRWSFLDDQTLPGPQTYTVAELRLADVRTEAQALAASRAKLKELTDQVRQARGEVRHKEHRIRFAREEAVRAGVDGAQVAKAARPPRQPRKSKVVDPAS